MKNQYEVRDDHVAISITLKHGVKAETLIDLEDLPRLLEFRGTIHGQAIRKTGRYYAIGRLFHNGVGREFFVLARFILNAPRHAVVDHKNPLETLDNRRSNLRIASYSLNGLNRAVRDKGVHKVASGWRATIRFHKTIHNLGNYPSEPEAMAAYAGAFNLACGIDASMLNGTVPTASEGGM